jgi:tRNA(Ile)-lysidine synthase
VKSSASPLLSNHILVRKLSAELLQSLRGLSKRKKYLIGVSGGLDSTVLLRSMVSSGFCKLTVCHLNHGLRGKESGEDQRFVRRLAAKLDLPLLTEKVDVQAEAKRLKLSTETTARNLRYQWFSKCAKITGIRSLLLAHHADDQAETILFRLLRGTGATGLGGMEQLSIHYGPPRLQIIRPFLHLRRQALLATATANQWKWREDSSNQSMEPSRNRLRHRVLPQLSREMGRDVAGPLLRAAALARMDAELLDQLTPELWKSPELPVSDLHALPKALRFRCLKKWLETHGPGPTGWLEVETAALILQPGGPAKGNLPAGWHVRRRSGRLFLQTP